MDSQCDKKPSPEWIQDIIVKAYIEKLLYRDEEDTMRYSLDIPDYKPSLLQHEGRTIDGVTTLSSASKPTKKAYTSPVKSKPASKPPKELRSATDIKPLPGEKKAKKLGEQYVARLFENKGYEVAMMPIELGFDILVMPTDFSKIMKVDVLVVQRINSPVIAIETCKEFHDRKVYTGINGTLADCYMIKICGVPGAYMVGTKALKKLIKDNCLKEATVLSGNYSSTMAILDRKIVLDKAIYII